MKPHAVGVRGLDLTVTFAPGRTEVTIRGEVDCYSARVLRERLLDLVRAGHYDLVLDLDQVGFLDSTGLGVFVGVLKRVRHHDGSVRLVCTQARILEILRITGLTQVFSVYPHLQAVG